MPNKKQNCAELQHDYQVFSGAAEQFKKSLATDGFKDRQALLDSKKRFREAACGILDEISQPRIDILKEAKRIIEEQLADLRMQLHILVHVRRSISRTIEVLQEEIDETERRLAEVDAKLAYLEGRRKKYED